jgi:EAL domain-containing protein (putative c-di-GMP-specific phosphodiesterase class I)
MSRQLHLTVVAEGVETSAQAHFLKEAGCQLLQGFLFSQAVPTTQLEELLVGNARWALDGRRLDAQTSVPTP